MEIKLNTLNETISIVKQNEYTAKPISEKIHDKNKNNLMKQNSEMIISFDKEPINETLTKEQSINRLNYLEKKVKLLEESNFFFEKIISQQQIACQTFYQQQYQQQMMYPHQSLITYQY